MKKFSLLFIFLGLALPVYSTVYFSTDWSGYTNGNLAGQSSWLDQLTFTNDVQVVDGSVVWGEDTKRAYIDIGKTLAAGESLYYAINLTVTGGNDTHTFLGFRPAGSVSQTGVIGIDLIGQDDYRIGLTNATSIEVGWDTSVTGQQYGEEYLVVVGYEFDTGISTLWLNPTSSASTSIATSALFDSRALSEFFFISGSGNDSIQSVSSLAIADTFAEAYSAAAVPEPGTYAVFAGLAVFGFVAFRRRRSTYSVGT